MSCKRCEDAQDNVGVSAFYRWKHANIEVRGCDEHLREIFDTLSAKQAEERKAANV